MPSVQIPFEGFYESSHDSCFDDYIENEQEYIKDENPNVTTKELQELAEKFHFGMDWEKAHNQYVIAYVSALEDLIKSESGQDIKLKFEEMTSPWEYNFTTDRIFAEISDEDIQLMFDTVDRKSLNEAIEKRFTSYDGFMSFYANSLSEWPTDLKEWDHNQLGCLMECYLENILETDNIYKKLKSWELMESNLCNGFIDTIVSDCAGSDYRDFYNKLRGESENDAS